MLNRLGAAMGGAGEHTLNADAAVASLADSLADPTAPPERRREAAERLRDLLADYPSAQEAAGSAGLPSLAAALRHQPRDLETLRAVLECLSSALGEVGTAAFASSNAAAAEADFQQTISPAAINCEIFSRDPANVSALLALLSPNQSQSQNGVIGGGEEGVVLLDVSSDLSIRYHATATLAALAASHAPRLASAVLSSPGGVGLLLDLLSDSHGAVAGEARPLLLRLARAAPEVQKIAAFEGAFEKLLAGARSATSVGEVAAAQDFLELAAALVERNPATQVLFREGGHTASLPSLLSVDGSDTAAAAAARGGGWENGRSRPNPNKRLTPQRTVVICAAIDLMMALVWTAESEEGKGGNAAVGASSATPTAAAEAARARAANQDTLLQYGGIQSLLALCMDNGGVPDDAVRVKAMNALGMLVLGNAGAQVALARTNITVVGKPLPVVQALLRTALRAPSVAERSAGDGVLRRLCCRNEEVQLELLGTISPVEPGFVPSNFGQELVRGLLNADPTLAVPSSSVAASLIRGSTRAKDYFLQLPVEAAPGTNGPHRLVLETLSATVSSYFDVQGGPQEERARPLATAAATLLIDWLVDCPKAVAALLCIPGCVDAASTTLIERPLPCDDLICCLSAVLLGECVLYCGEDIESQAVSKDIIMSRVGLAKYFGALGRLQSYVSLDDPASQSPLTREMRTFLSGFESTFQHALVAPAAASLPLTLHDSSHPPSSSVDSTPSTDAKRLQEVQATISALESQLQQARISSAAPVLSNGAPPADLQARCSELQAQLDAARANAATSAAAAAKYERDLQDLAGAYAGLEAHAQDLESRVASLGSSSGGAATTASDPSEIERRITEAADAARAEGEAGLEDLLVCLGEEERKVEVLSAKLAELGVDTGALLAAASSDEKRTSACDDLT